MVPVPADRSPAGGVIRRWVAVALAVIGVLVPAVVVVAAMAPAASLPAVTRPYARVPSEALGVADRIEVTAVTRHPAQGELLFVTVREPKLDALSWWVGRGEPAVIDGLTPEQKSGPLTPSQERQRNRLLMAGAKNTAQYVALSRLGYDVEVRPGKVVVDDLVCLEADGDGRCTRPVPADAVLDPDDLIVSVDGTEISVVDDLTEALAGRAPGDVVAVELEREGEGALTVDVELIASPGDPERTIIGFVPFDTSTVVLPFEVEINTDSIGGPSAGLAFTLGLLDELTPGELTGGKRVAVTGTIAPDGAVGPIGGVVQKAEAVKQAGADLFIVPASQSDAHLAQVREVAGDDLEVVTVSTIDEALDALAARGGSGIGAGSDTPGG